LRKDIHYDITWVKKRGSLAVFEISKYALGLMARARIFNP